MGGVFSPESTSTSLQTIITETEVISDASADIISGGEFTLGKGAVIGSVTTSDQGAIQSAQDIALSGLGVAQSALEASQELAFQEAAGAREVIKSAGESGIDKAKGLAIVAGVIFVLFLVLRGRR